MIQEIFLTPLMIVVFFSAHVKSIIGVRNPLSFVISNGSKSSCVISIPFLNRSIPLGTFAQY